MKWKKVISGVLAAAMVMTSVVSTPLFVSAGTGTKIGVSEIHYTAPAVGGQPKQVTAVIDQHHDTVSDRAENPAAMEAVDGNTAAIQQKAGVWGFNAQMKSASGADKFNVRGDAQMLVSFRMYLAGYAGEGEYCSIISKGEQYGIQLTSNGLRLYMQTEQGAVRNVSYANCFEGGLNRWYDVVAIIDARNSSKSRIYVDGQASDMMSHRNIISTDDPFALGCKVTDSTASEKFTTDCGYLADVRFYNSRVMSSEDNETFRQSLNLDALDRLADDGWSVIRNLIDTVKPTGNFSLKPYDMETVWTTEGEPVDDVFQCGYAYTATTVFRAHDGYHFGDNTSDSIQFTDEYAYEKIALTEDCGVAASQETQGESNGSQGLGKFAIDGDRNTYWHTRYSAATGGNNVNLSAGQNNTYTITLPEKARIGQFGYLPRQSSTATVNGTIYDYSLWYKENSNGEWQALVVNGHWAENTSQKYVEFDPVEAKEVQIRVTRASGGNFITAAEFEVFKAVPQSNGTASVTLSENDTVMTVAAQYGEIPCTSEIERVAFSSAATLEKGQTHQITSSVYASDGRLVSAHKGLLEQSKEIAYAYQAKAEDGTSDTDVITVNGTTGQVTALKAGTAIVKATATLNGQTLGSRDIRITVLEQNKRLENPIVSYTSPVGGNYPQIAYAGVQRSDLANEMLVDVVEGGSTLSLIEGAAAPVFECVDHITGFSARYQASAADQQFNVTGENPMVITLKLYLKQLPTDTREHTIVSKGNQYNLVVMKRGNGHVLRFQISGGNWSAWAYTIDNDFLNKWHDIVIVADGKGKANSVGFFVDGVYCNNKIQGSGIPSISTTDGSSSHLRQFAVCDKTEEANMQFTADDGYLARLRFYNINQIDPLGQLAEKIDINALGTDNAATIIRTLLDAVTPTAHITATPYSIETTWYTLNGNEETPMEATMPFTNENILNNGYSVRTVFRTFGGFAFNNTIDTSKVKEWLTISPEVDEDLYECSAALRDGGRELEIRVAFLPARIPVQKFTYASPASDRTYRRLPRYDEDAVEKYMTVAETKWLTNGTTEITDPEATFAPITDSNWYRAESVLTAKNVYRFDESPDYITEVKENIQTQVFGNVEAEKTVTVSEDGTTMKIWLDYKKPIYQVTFDADGGTGSDLEPQSVSQGRTAVEPEHAPEKEGYAFEGWYVGDSENEYDFSTQVTANVSLKAKWKATYTVTFHPNLSGFDDIVRSIGSDGKVTAATVRPSTNITFAGWFEKEANGSWKENAFDFNTVITKNMDLYAKWNATVTFKDSEEVDAEVIKTVNVESGTAVTESEIPSPGSKEGYDFDHWYIKTDDGETEFTKDTVINEHTTVYAKWEAKTYNVTYELGGGSWPQGYTAPATVKHGESLSVTTDPIKDNMAFGGWYLDQNATQRYDFSPATGNITIYARWTDATVYTVTYDANTEGAEVTPSSVRIVENETVMVAPQAVKEHWEVEGWYKDEAFTQKFIFGANGTTVTENITLYAKWQRKQYTVIFQVNGGSAVDNKTVESETTIQDAPVSTKEGYELEGWYRDAAFTQKFVFGTDPILRDTTLYARWIIPVSGITIEPQTVSMKVGEEPVQLTATVLPADATDKNVTWTSENPRIANVSEDGLVTALAEGTAKITASAGGKTAEATVTVEDDGSLEKKRVLRAEQDFGVKSWTSDQTTSYTNRKILVVRNEEHADSGFGSVGEGMLVNGQAGNDSSISLLQFDLSRMTGAEREALKTATLRLCLAGSRNASTDNRLVAAVVPAESGLTDLTDKTTWRAVSETVTDWLSNSEHRFKQAGISETYSDNGGKDMNKAAPSNPAVYISSDITEAVKTVLEDVTVRKLILAINETKGAEQYFVRTAGAIGNDKFSGATDEMAPSILLTYEGEEATEVIVTPKTKTLTSAGEQVQMEAVVGPDTAMDKTVTWTSSNPEVATVDNTGMVTAVSNGQTTITATANGALEGEEVKDTAEITVAMPCSCEIGELTVAGGTSIRIRSSQTSGTLQLSALAAVNGTCQIPGHPDGNGITYTYEIQSGAANTANATVNGTTGLVTATQAGEVEVTVNAALADGAENKTTVTKNVTIKVTKLAEGFFAVDFHANTNGNDAEVKNMPEGLAVEDGTRLEQPASPSWEGHTFKGWSAAPNGEIITWPHEITTDMDLYAIWEERGITDAEARAALDKAIADAKEIYEGPDVYTNGTWNPFKGAYEAATGNLEGLTAAEIKQLADDLTGKTEALVVDGNKLAAAMPDILADAKLEIDGGNTQYMTDSWDNYANAYKKLSEAVDNPDGVSPEELIRLYQELVAAKRNLAIDKGWVDAKTALNQALNQASGIFAAGGSKYETSAWNAFKDAYNAAYALRNAKVADVTAETLKRLATALNQAREKLSLTALKKGDYVEQNGIRYVVTDAAAKTVSAEGIASQKKKLKKAVILATVSVNGVTCKVTEIKEKAFSKFNRLTNVTIGSNVQLIGKQAFNGCKKLKKIIFKGNKAPTFKAKAFKGTSSSMTVKLSKALKKGKIKKTMIKKLKKAGISKKAKIK